MKIGTKAKHFKFGEGEVVGQRGDIVKVAFPVGKEFEFGPEQLVKFFELPEDARLEAETAWKAQQERAQREEAERAERKRLEQEARERRLQEEREAKARPRAPRTAREAKKPHYKPKNIAFKCVYCDGGKREGRIGYDGVCSEETRTFNLRHHKSGWCNHSECPCKKYRNGTITREELDEKFEINNASICYEANLFRAWEYSAGWSEDGKSHTIRADLKHKLCILTTRLPKAKSKERYIFGAFIIDDYEEGDADHAGRVIAHPELRVELNESEMKQMCFWNYYRNDSVKAPYQWGSGLFRYLDDDASVKKILEDIKAIKSDPADKALLDEMLKFF